MLLHIVARGKIGRSPEAELVERYLKRIAWPVKLTELPEKGGKVPPPPPDGVTIVLDERGLAISSTELAKKLEAWRDGGKREALSDRRAQRPWRRAAPRRRPAPLLRARDLAAPASPRHARRAIVPRDIDPCEPPLSSRRLGT